jgi:hypothetical protein
MIVYNGSVADAPEVIQFSTRSGETEGSARLVVNGEKTVVFDVNKDGMGFPE